MAILDIFRKKKKKPMAFKPASRARGILAKEAAILDEKEKPKRAEEKKTEGKSKEVRFGRSYKILKSPHVTEKAGDLTEKNQYVFRVFPRTNKMEVKKAIENTYGVDVVSVKIINAPEKKRRLGKIQGTKPGYKKAIVKIKKGQKIEVLPR